MPALAVEPGVFGLKLALAGVVPVDSDVSWELAAAGNRWSISWLGISPPAPRSPSQTHSQEENNFITGPTGVFFSFPSLP